MEIRQGQLDALTKAREEEFRRQLKEALVNDYPEDCESLGEEKLNAVIEDGLRRARSYGIVTEEDIGLYFDIMFNLVYNFDTNPKYPWAAPILRDPQLSAEEKLRHLSALAEEALDQEGEEES